MSTLRRSTRAIAATIAAFAVVVGLAIGGPAHATEVAPPPVDDSSLTDPAPPIDTSLPGVAERIAEIEANGGEILGGSSVQYVEEGTSDDDVVARAFPSGCATTSWPADQRNAPAVRASHWSTRTTATTTSIGPSSAP